MCTEQCRPGHGGWFVGSSTNTHLYYRRAGYGFSAWTDARSTITLSSAPYSLPENLIKLKWKKMARSRKGEPLAEHINLLQLGQVDVQPLQDRIKALQGTGEPPQLWTEEVERKEEGETHSHCLIGVFSALLSSSNGTTGTENECLFRWQKGKPNEIQARRERYQVHLLGQHWRRGLCVSLV